MIAFIATFCALVTMVLVAQLGGNPTNEQIRDACRGHGRTVDYVPTGWFSFSSGQKVVCSNGDVLEVRW